MKKKHSQFFKAFLILIIFSQEILARAGGGGGGSGGGGGGGGGFRGRSSRSLWYYSYSPEHGWVMRSNSLPMTKYDVLFLILFFSIVSIVIYSAFKAKSWIRTFKAKKVNKILLQSSLIDPLWDKIKLEEFIKISYLKVQDAWMKQNMNLVNGLVSNGIQNQFQIILNKQIESNVYNYLGRIQFNEIKIVGMEDFIDNEKDNFAVYISGNMVDLILRYHTTASKKAELKKFEDLYFFKRSGNSWVITEISNRTFDWNYSSFPTYRESLNIK